MINKKLFIELHVNGFDNTTKDFLIEAFYEAFMKNSTDACIKFLSHERYWAVNKKHRCLFSIKSNKELLPETLADILHLSFDVHSGEALWTAFNNQETFLHKDVTHVFIYKQDSPRIKKELNLNVLLYCNFYDPATENFLITKLSEGLSQHPTKLHSELLSTQQYWNAPETTECFFGIFSEEGLKVKDFLNIFDVSFGLMGRGENAIWSSQFHGGVLFHKNVFWATIYIPFEKRAS